MQVGKMRRYAGFVCLGEKSNRSTIPYGNPGMKHIKNKFRKQTQKGAAKGGLGNAGTRKTV